MAYNRKELEAKIAREAANQGVDPFLALSLVQQESGFNPNAKSSSGAIGLFQLMPNTAKGLKVNPNNVDQNIKGGVTYLRQQLKTYGGNVDTALAAYNAGPVAVQAYRDGKSITIKENGKTRVINPNKIKTPNGIPPYKETRGYVKNINNYYNSRVSQLPNKTTPLEEIAQGFAQGVTVGGYKAPPRFQDKPLSKVGEVVGQLAPSVALSPFGGTPAILAGLAAQGAIAEKTRQEEEWKNLQRDKTSAGRIATNALSNAVLGLLPVSAPGKVLGRTITGAGLGAGGTLASNIAGDIIDPNVQRDPSEGVGEAATFGGLFGSLFGKRTSTSTVPPVASPSAVAKAPANLMEPPQAFALPPLSTAPTNLLPSRSTAEARLLPQGNILVGGINAAPEIKPVPTDLTNPLATVPTQFPQAPEITIGRPQENARKLSLPSQEGLDYAAMQQQIQENLGLPINVAPVAETNYTNAFVADSFLDAKNQLNLPNNATTKDIYNAAKQQGYDGVIYQTKQGVRQAAFPENKVEVSQQQTLPLEMQTPLKLIADQIGVQPTQEYQPLFPGLTDGLEEPNFIADSILPKEGQILFNLENTPAQIKPLSPLESGIYTKAPSLKNNFRNPLTDTSINITYNNHIERALSKLADKTATIEDKNYLKQTIVGASDEQIKKIATTFKKQVVNKALSTKTPIDSTKLAEIVNQETLPTRVVPPEPTIEKNAQKTAVAVEKQKTKDITAAREAALKQEPSFEEPVSAPTEILPEASYIPLQKELPEGAYRTQANQKIIDSTRVAEILKNKPIVGEKADGTSVPLPDFRTLPETIKFLQANPDKALEITYYSDNKKSKGARTGTVGAGGVTTRTIVPLALEEISKEKNITLKGIRKDQVLAKYSLNKAKPSENAFIQSFKIVDNPGIDNSFFYVAEPEGTKSKDIAQMMLNVQNKFKSLTPERQNEVMSKIKLQPLTIGKELTFEKNLNSLTLQELKALEKEVDC